jgi:ATP-dependent Clp protease ATP-binding subunit ClpC
VPEILRNKRMVVLDLALMVAGTKYRGQFEERIKAVMTEVRRVARRDPVHRRAAHARRRRRRGRRDRRVERAQARAVARRDPVHRRDDARRVPQAHREGRRARAALPGRDRRASDSDRAVAILKGLRDRYEAHHRVKYTDEALELAVELSTRYINNRFLPDKAIDVMDEAGARVRIKSMVPPPTCKEISNEIERLDRAKDEAVTAQDFEKAAQLRDQAYQLRKKKEEMQKGLALGAGLQGRDRLRSRPR